jgi:16S rRNA processing protein RimM
MIVLGRVSAPYGIQGWVKVHVFGDDPLALIEMPTWWLGRDPDSSEGWKAVELQDSREQGGALVAMLEGVADRTAAESLKGMYVGAPRESLPVPAEDEFYWGDLIGLAVVTEEGESLGRVSGLIESGAHDVLVVRDEQYGTEAARERLLPFVAKVVRRVDVAGGVIRVDWGADW